MTSSSENDRTGGNDAVAFTSGWQGVPFSAGVVHAWLAADRKQPLVATGISMATFAATAMRRVYEELEHPGDEELEVKRWRWYQRYYDAVTGNPIGPLWKALPDPVDFFAETPPAKDTSVPGELRDDSENARRHFYLLTSLGVWLAHLPVRVSTLVTFVVMYVRRTENYGNKIQNGFFFYWSAFIGVLGIWFHLVRRPQWVWENEFESTSGRRMVRPLFGWSTYLAAVILLPVLVFGAIRAVAMLLYWILQWIARPDWLRWTLLPLLFAGLFFLIDQIVRALILASGKPKSKGWLRRMFGGWLAKIASDNLDISHGLLHSYEIKRAIYDLFVKGAPDYVKTGPGPGAVKTLLVCAALEEIDQVILKNEMPIMEALTASIALPGLLPPEKVHKRWIANKTITHPEFFRIIDGAAVRTNPLPAVFEWLKRIDTSEIATRLESGDLRTASLHVVYNVPTGYAGSVQNAPGMECPDIVLSAQKALQLSRRRDTRQEVRQTNTLSRLELQRRRVFPGTRRAFAILADEIAPREEIDLGNELSPDRDSLRRVVADGCRAALEMLYREQIGDLAGMGGKVHCLQLIRRIAPRRTNAVAECSGLRLVCERCPQLLEYRPPQKAEAPQDGVLRTYGCPEEPRKERLTHLFPQLAQPDPNCHDDEAIGSDRRGRVAFLGSGGVFRGAFHIGVLAAMYAAELYPDLVIGASVGTLMGGALCRMTACKPDEAPQVLAELAELFTNVDKEVALTFTLKSAVKQLGIRARCIRLSPAELARKIARGSQADPGFAATGAPPVLTDALSSLFTIPHRNTSEITSDFVAGHFSSAIVRFLKEVRRETLPSFGIGPFVMGVSLLERAAERLLGFSSDRAELSKAQPYQGKTPSGRKVALFATTSFLNASTSLLLGRDFLTTAAAWSATQEGLCSSAFPAVFGARSEAELMPGAGRADRFFADGGMFDNLPFFPAIEVLSAVQSSAPIAEAGRLERLLRARAANPDLLIAAALNEKAFPDEHVVANTFFDVRKRAKMLSYDSKTRTFVTAARKSIQMLFDLGHAELTKLSDHEKAFLNGFVGGTVVSITPTDAAHINPTFAFCRSMGLRPKRVQASIGDGCYRSLEEFSRNEHVQAKLGASGNRIERKAEDDRSRLAGPGICPYFTKGGKPFACPFTLTGNRDARSVFEICRKDVSHRSASANPSRATSMTDALAAGM